MVSVFCKSSKAFHYKNNPVVERCTKAYFLSFVFFREVITMFEVLVLIIVLNLQAFEFLTRLICLKITLFSLQL